MSYDVSSQRVAVTGRCLENQNTYIQNTYTLRIIHIKLNETHPDINDKIVFFFSHLEWFLKRNVDEKKRCSKLTVQVWSSYSRTQTMRLLRMGWG